MDSGCRNRDFLTGGVLYIKAYCKLLCEKYGVNRKVKTY